MQKNIIWPYSIAYLSSMRIVGHQFHNLYFVYSPSYHIISYHMGHILWLIQWNMYNMVHMYDMVNLNKVNLKKRGKCIRNCVLCTAML